eukprot:1139345-Pelagomonas_calceolata.AAC.4
MHTSADERMLISQDLRVRRVGLQPETTADQLLVERLTSIKNGEQSDKIHYHSMTRTRRGYRCTINVPSERQFLLTPQRHSLQSTPTLVPEPFFFKCSTLDMLDSPPVLQVNKKDSSVKTHVY